MPLLVDAAPAALVEAVASATIVVAGLSSNWRREGLGEARRALVRRRSTDAPRALRPATERACPRREPHPFHVDDRRCAELAAGGIGRGYEVRPGLRSSGIAGFVGGRALVQGNRRDCLLILRCEEQVPTDDPGEHLLSVRRGSEPGRLHRFAVRLLHLLERRAWPDSGGRAEIPVPGRDDVGPRGAFAEVDRDAGLLEREPRNRRSSLCVLELPVAAELLLVGGLRQAESGAGDGRLGDPRRVGSRRLSSGRQVSGNRNGRCGEQRNRTGDRSSAAS